MRLRASGSTFQYARRYLAQLGGVRSKIIGIHKYIFFIGVNTCYFGKYHDLKKS